MNASLDETSVIDDLDGETPCSVFYEIVPDPSSSIFTIVPFALIYSTIFVLGIAGNVAVIYVTSKHRTLQTVQNMFILNLAASDIIVCLLSLPITPVTNIYKNWFFGPLLCRLIPWVQGVSIFICTFSLGAIAVDRYILVVHPHTPPLSKRGAMVVTGILWTLSILVTIPYAVYMYVDTYADICGCFCTEKWPNAQSRRAYTMVVMCAQFVVPFIVMAFCYATIFHKLKSRAKVRLRKLDACWHALENTQPSTLAPNIQTDGVSGADQKANLLDRQDRGRAKLLAQTRRTTCILAAMVVMFGLTWLPHNIVSLIIEYDESRTFFSFFGHDLNYLVNLFTHSIAMTNNISNPVLYAWLNPTFRQLVMSTCFGRKKGANGRGGRPVTSVMDQKSTIRTNYINGETLRGAGSQDALSAMRSPTPNTARAEMNASPVVSSEDVPKRKSSGPSTSSAEAAEKKISTSSATSTSSSSPSKRSSIKRSASSRSSRANSSKSSRSTVNSPTEERNSSVDTHHDALIYLEETDAFV